jgi:hypothetical protein
MNLDDLIGLFNINYSTKKCIVEIGVIKKTFGYYNTIKRGFPYLLNGYGYVDLFKTCIRKFYHKVWHAYSKYLNKEAYKKHKKRSEFRDDKYRNKKDKEGNNYYKVLYEKRFGLLIKLKEVSKTQQDTQELKKA